MIQEAKHICATCGKVVEHMPEIPDWVPGAVLFVVIIGAITVLKALHSLVRFVWSSKL